jgi:hypothetical protein
MSELRNELAQVNATAYSTSHLTEQNPLKKNVEERPNELLFGSLLDAKPHLRKNYTHGPRRYWACCRSSGVILGETVDAVISNVVMVEIGYTKRREQQQGRAALTQRAEMPAWV